jgi:hypothetical protein
MASSPDPERVSVTMSISSHSHSFHQRLLRTVNESALREGKVRRRKILIFMGIITRCKDVDTVYRRLCSHRL